MPLTVDKSRINQSGEFERSINNLQTQIDELVEQLKGKPSKNPNIAKAEGWDDLRLAGSTLGTGASAPSQINFAGSTTVKVRAFNGTTATVDELFFEVQLPHSWKEKDGYISPHVHWTPSGTNTGNVVWQLTYTWANIGNVFPAVTTLTATSAASGTAWTHILAEFPDIPATGKTFSSMLVGRLFRDPGHTSDNYEQDAALLELDFHYVVNSFGSYEEYKSFK